MILPRLVYVTNDCTYPLHPSENYEGEAHVRTSSNIPAEVRVILVPRWMRYPPGEWHWCKRCTRRDATRRTLVQSLYEESQKLPRTWGQMTLHNEAWRDLDRITRLVDRPKYIRTQFLGGRFATHCGQTQFARRHAPPGLLWCPWGLHYAPPRPGRTGRSVSRERWCEPCYKRYVKCVHWRKFAQWMQDASRARQDYTALEAQARSLRKEVAELRQLKLALLDEMARLPAREPWEEAQRGPTSDATLIVGPWEGSQRPEIPVPVTAAHQARHASRRRAFSA